MNAGSSDRLLIAGLDIGSTRVELIMGLVQSQSQNPQRLDLEVVGLGTAPSMGVRQGVVINVDETVHAVMRAREEAELMSGRRVEEVYLAVGGLHVRSFDSKGMVAIRNREVRPDDVSRVIEAAKAVAVPADRQVLHVLPREFTLDEQSGIADPLGMTGVRLEASVHIVTASQMALHNVTKCVEKAGLRIRGLVLQQVASSLSVLSEDERKLGVALVDIGGGTSDVIIHINGSVAHTCSIPVGGQHFTQDIAMGLRTPQTSAEKMKRAQGCAIADLVAAEESIEVEGVGGRKPRTILRRDLCAVIEPRAEETMNIIWDEIFKSGFSNQLGGGVVLTGGACQLEGLVELAEFVCSAPVRLGPPDRAGGLKDLIRTPDHATAVGLLLYGMEHLSSSEKMRLSHLVPSPEPSVVASMTTALSDIGKKLRDFFIGPEHHG